MSGGSEPPIWINEDWCPDPEGDRVKRRRYFEERRYQRALASPPERSLAELRRSCSLSQAEVALRLGVKQLQVSRLERRSNPTLRTVHAYVQALGGTLELIARFPTRAAKVRISGWASPFPISLPDSGPEPVARPLFR